MYKNIDKKKITQIKKIEKEFLIISKIASKEKSKIYWWFHEISRLDFRPWGGLNTNNYLSNDVKILNFTSQLLRDFIKINIFIFKGLFIRRKKFFYKNIFVSENVIFTKKIKDFYFNGFFSKTKSKVRIVTSLSETNKKGPIGLNQLVGFNEKFKMLFHSLFILIRLHNLIKNLVKRKKIDKFWIDYFFIKENLRNLYTNLLLFSFVSNNVFCENIIFPYEEKTFERSIISALDFSKQKKKVKVFGICVNPQHNLSSFLKKFEGLDIPRTNRYLFCGPLYRKYFKKLNRKNILSLNKKDCLGSLKSKILKTKLNKSKVFLFLMSHLEEYYRLADYVRKQKKLQKYKFIIRPYPHSLDKIKILNHIKNVDFKNFQISESSLKQDIKKSFAIIFSGTSAGIEAINYGRIGIWSNLSGVGINPLFDNLKYFLPSLNANQLEKKIHLIDKMSKIGLNKILNKQQKFCQNIYSKLDINIINKYFN